MSNLILHDYNIHIPGVSRKVIYHFSDVHLCLSDEASTPEECAKAAEKTQSWETGRLGFAKHHGEPCDEAHPIAATEYFEQMLQAAAADGNALVVAGDMFDYTSGANVRAYDKCFGHLPLPYMMVRGNHESINAIPDDSRMAEIKRPVQILDLGDVILVGFDDAKRVITQEQLDELASLLAQPKPLILAMHIPIQVEGNAAHQQCDDYFRLNYDGAPEENLAFIEMIRQNAGKIAAVLCGHLHFLNTCTLAPGLTQYVSSQGLLGNLNRYVIGE